MCKNLQLYIIFYFKPKRDSFKRNNALGLNKGLCTPVLSTHWIYIIGPILQQNGTII